jgi:ATP-binding cassette subfamily B protein
MVFVSVFYVIAALITTCLTSPTVALFYLVAVPLAAGIIRLFRRKISSRTQEFRVELETMSARVSDMIEMIPVTRAHGVERVEIARMNSQLERVKRKGIHLDVINAIFVSSTWVTMTLFGVGCLLATAWMSYHGRLRVGDVVMYYGYFQIILGSVSMMLAIYPQLAKGFESIQSIGEVLECPDVEQNAGKREAKTVGGNFLFENVNFAYNGAKRPAVRNFSLEVQANDCIAFVGESGSGKSTVMNLIIGFRRPTSGRILLDGVDMEALDLRTFRRSLAVVSQNTILFSGSIRDNITYGLDDVSEEALRRAVRMAHAEDFIDALPDGLDTMIGEHGGKLSGGQRQRIAIARALIRNPKVIIFDEATSALDVASERLVQQAMEELIEGRTTFIVAHRLSTIRHAHRIVVMRKGECVEVGSYEELVARKGEFHRLVSLQL